MDFTLETDLEALRDKVRAFVASEILPLEQDATAYDDHENIAPSILAGVREKAQAAGLWAPQPPITSF